MARLELPVMKTSLRAPAESASSAAYWISGLSTIGNISFGLALVAGRNRVPRPATGNTAVRISLTWLTSRLHWIERPDDKPSRPPEPVANTAKRRQEQAAATAAAC